MGYSLVLRYTEGEFILSRPARKLGAKRLKTYNIRPHTPLDTSLNPIDDVLNPMRYVSILHQIRPYTPLDTFLYCMR